MLFRVCAFVALFVCLFVTVVYGDTGCKCSCEPGVRVNAPDASGDPDCPCEMKKRGECGCPQMDAKPCIPPIPVYDECMTDHCRAQAFRIVADMDWTVDPCDDFYNFACGGFKKNHPLRPGDLERSYWTIINERIKEQRTALLMEPISDNDILAVSNTKALYQSCINQEAIETRGFGELGALFQTYGLSWPMLDPGWSEESYDLLHQMLYFHLLGQATFIYFTVYEDPRDNRRYILEMGANLLYGLTPYYYHGYPSDVAAYKKYLTDLADLIMPGTDHTQDIQDILDWEAAIYNIVYPNVDTKVIVPLSYINESYPAGFDYSTFAKYIFEDVGITLPEDEPVLLYFKDTIATSIDYILNSDRRTLANVMSFYMARRLVHQLPSSALNVYAEYHRYMYGYNPEPRECLDYCPTIQSHMFVKRYLPIQARNDVEEIALQTKAQAAAIISVTPWLSHETRKLALEKLEAMTMVIGFQDWLWDDDVVNDLFFGFEFHPERFLFNFVHKESVLRRQRLPMLRYVWNIDTITFETVQANAFYNDALNSLVIFAGILQPPFYEYGCLRLVNMAIAGNTIAHEIGHGFDAVGGEYDADGNYVYWWSQRSFHEYQDRKQCLINEYDHILVEQINKYVNGELTLSENIADNFGLTVSHQSYKTWAHAMDMENVTLAYTSLTPEQLFYVANIQVDCANIQDQFLEYRLENDVHTPYSVRGFGTLVNYPPFAKAFQCRPGSKMNPKHKCHVW